MLKILLLEKGFSSTLRVIIGGARNKRHVIFLFQVEKGLVDLLYSGGIDSDRDEKEAIEPPVGSFQECYCIGNTNTKYFQYKKFQSVISLFRLLQLN